MGGASQVIIGNSAAGLSAIRAIRELDSSCPITLISTEDCPAYSPVLLTYYLNGRIGREGVFMADGRFYESHSVKTLLGKRAVGVNVFNHAVLLEDGRAIDFDRLLIATGASSIPLGKGNRKSPRRIALRTLEDADRILEFCASARDAVVIGAGFIGMQTAEALSGRGIRTTILESAEHVFPEIMDGEFAALVQSEMGRHGVSLVPGRRVVGVEEAGDRAAVMDDSGRTWEADFVVACAGVRPNVQLLENSGIEMERGIEVDDFMQTGLPDIFAAGDVARGRNLLTGQKEVLPNWIVAVQQGRTAGLNMCGGREIYGGGIRENVCTVFGMELATFGESKLPLRGDLEEIRYCAPEKKIYRRILIRGDRIMGAVLLGKIDDAGVIKSLMIRRTDLSPARGEIARAVLDWKKNNTLAFFQNAEVHCQMKLQSEHLRR